MPYHTFVAGEEATAADVNTYLAGQTVPRFTNATQRSSQLSAPVLNQLSMLDNRPGQVDYWTGSAWAETDGLYQSAQVAGTTNANGDMAATFPRPFGMTPVVVGNAVGINVALVVIVLGLSSTTVTFRIFAAGFGIYANSAVTVGYVAIGVRP